MNLLLTVQNLKYKTMSFYRLKCKNNTESIQEFSKLICRSEKSRFISKQEANGIWYNLGMKTPLNKISLLGDISLKI